MFSIKRSNSIVHKVPMLIVIRNEEKLSAKARFLIELLKKENSIEFLFVFKKESQKFSEKWYKNDVELPFSYLSIVLYYLLIIIKSPKELRDSLMVRLNLIKRKHVLIAKGFLSALSRSLFLRFGASVRAKRLLLFFKQMETPKIFVIDEFLSVNCFNLKSLHLLGPVIYVSQDIAYNQFAFRENFITKTLMFRLERDAVMQTSLVVACSEMEKFKYLEMGAKESISYPNIYPTEDFIPFEKDETPSISIVLREHWGQMAIESLETIVAGLVLFKRPIQVYLIGLEVKQIPKNVILQHYRFIANKTDFLKIISKSWVGINVGIHMAGTNERKYDYAEAATVVLSDTNGARGDLLPYEYTYVDQHDLAAKLSQLLDVGKQSLITMGKENRKHVLSFAENKRKDLLKSVSNIISTA